MQATANATSKRRMAETRQVYLSVDEHGRIVADPYYAIFQLGDELVWVCEDDFPWAIGFHDKRSPTKELVIHGRGKEAVGTHKALRSGHFTYSVALYQELHPLIKQPTIFLDATCPEIIIAGA